MIKDEHGNTVARIVGRFHKSLGGGRKLLGISYAGAPRQCSRGLRGERWASNPVALHVRFERFKHVYARFSPVRQREPEVLYLGASQRIFSLNWSNWDSRHAVGYGTFPANNCIPYCAAGKITDYPVQVKFSKPRNCSGTWFYGRLRYDSSGAGPDGETGFGGCHYANGGTLIRGPEVLARHLNKRALG
jgi:hypothetical protein